MEASLCYLLINYLPIYSIALPLDAQNFVTMAPAGDRFLEIIMWGNIHKSEHTAVCQEAVLSLDVKTWKLKTKTFNFKTKTKTFGLKTKTLNLKTMASKIHNNIQTSLPYWNNHQVG